MSSDEEDEIEERFSKATTFVQLNAQSIDKDNLLKFYAFYKQATVGSCNTQKPSWYEMEAKAKWSSWYQLGDMTQTQSMQEYADLLSKLRPDWEEIASSSKDKGKSSWISVSCMKQDDEFLDHENKTTFDWIKEGDVEMIRSSINLSDINKLDDTGMGLIHWAADRGNILTIKTLLEFSPDINLLDESGQTALHYASACGHSDVVKILLDNGASVTIKDSDGMTAMDVAMNEEVSSLLTQAL